MQPAFLQAVPIALAAIRVLRTLELAGTLFATLSEQRGRYGTVLGTTAHEFRGAEDFEHMPAIWVGQLDRASLDDACPETGRIQARFDAVLADVRRSRQFQTPARIGIEAHSRMHTWVGSQGRSDLKSEYSITKDGQGGSHEQLGTSRLDILHQPEPAVTCIYDLKTGRQGLEWPNALRYATVAKKHFPNTQRIIIIQVRPSS